MIRIENVSRRDVLRAGGVFVVATTLPGCGEKAAAPTPAPIVASGPPEDLNLFVGIDDAGGVRIMCHRAEMGQHAKTGMARVIADELEADWDRVSIEFTDGDPKWGDQNTDGSTTIRNDFMRLRRIGASARSMLERAAATRWDAPISECKAVLHEVVHEASGRRLGYGELALAAAALEPPAYEGDALDTAEDVYRLKDPSEWRYIGKPAAAVDTDDIVRGAAIYGQDLSLPGMKFAVIARPPVFFGKVVSFDASAARAVAGVIDVREAPVGESVAGFNPLGGVAVIAENTWAAIQGRRALSIEWEDGPNAAYDSGPYRAALEETVRQPQRIVRDTGDVEAAFREAAQTIAAEYYAPHFSHAQMEPPAAVAKFEDGKIEVWTSSQNLQSARQTIADVTGVAYEDVRVYNALLGGGFGRKSKPDYACEAALLSRDLGAPVKVVWTREDDLKHDYLHTVTAQRLEAAMDKNGRVTAWRHRTAMPSIAATFNPTVEDQMPIEMFQGLADNPFAIDNMRMETGKAKSMIRVGWLRSVINIPSAFAIQSFAAELAHAADRDPKEFLLELIGPDRKIDLATEGIAEGVDPWNYGASFEEHPIDTARLKNVINIAADRIGWRTDLPDGRGMGIAAHRSFLTYVATIFEVAVNEEGALSIPRVAVACDCGVAANPESVRAQMEGGTIYGISNMLNSAITITGGRVDQSNFHDYQVIRMPEAPREIMVDIIESAAPPGGVGEPGTPPAAPALANAIFAATGKRVRALPIGDQLRA